MTAGPHDPSCCAGGTACATAPRGRGCCRTVSNCGGPMTWCQTTTSVAKAATIVPIYPSKASNIKIQCHARDAPGAQPNLWTRRIAPEFNPAVDILFRTMTPFGFSVHADG